MTEKTDHSQLGSSISHLISSKYSFADLLDIGNLRRILNSFSSATGFATGLVEYPSGKILVATGWRNICNRFHRAFPESVKHCIESNRFLLEQLEASRQITVRPCKNGLIDGASPIIIAGKHIASLFTGQVLFEKPDTERFKKQAETYGYDIEAYLKALSQVPIVTENQFKNVLSFLSQLAEVLAETALNNLKLKEQTSKLLSEITDRNKTAKALRVSETKYATMVENSRDGIVLIQDGLISFVNKASFKIVGYSPEELIGKTFINYVAPKHQEFILKIYVELMEGKDVPSHHEIELLRKDGATVHVELDAKRIFFEGTYAMHVFIRDITQRKMADEALRESEEIRITALEANPDPIVVYDIKGRVIYFNPAFANVFGWRLEERIGMKMDQFVPEEAWPETKMMIEKVLAGERFINVETKRLTEKGDIIPVSISGAVYKDRDGNPLGSVINIRDISEKKKLEGQLLQAQRMESLGTLAGGIAHDFNNLLMGIQGRASMILTEVDSPKNPYFPHLKGIEEYVKKATNLTSQLLGFARGGKYEVKPTDINAIITKENRLFGRTRKEIQIREKLEKNLWTTHVDRGQIEQVLLNIYVNAWHAMPGGGIIIVQTENVTIDESFLKTHQLKSGKYIKISIRDTGIGMDASTQEKIFDPFFTTKDKDRGTGLGLASAYGIVKNHGGMITVYSEMGHGTVFCIYLPASEDKVKKEEVIKDKIIFGSETILLVEDEEMVLEVNKQMLKKLGYRVIVADSGEQALKIIQSKGDEIELVILDMIMPGMDGGKVFDFLHGSHPEIPVILSSGYTRDGQADKIMSRGCNAFIQKPFNVVKLSRKIREVLANKN